MVFLELRREPGVCSRVTAVVAIRNFCLFSDVRTPFKFRWTSQESKLCWQDNTDPSGGEAGDRGSLSSWNSDIGIPIHFQKESVIVTFSNIELRVPLEVSKGCYSPCPDEAESYGFL